MDPCRICGNPTEPTDKTVLCSGSCARFFHPSCVGLNTTNHKAWTANVGLLWFCDVCRVNFNPVVMDRETVLLKTLRDLLIRVDSMDLRIGQYGENLKLLNTLLSSVPPNRRESNTSHRLQQLHSGHSSGNALADFHSSIDRINLDSSLHSQWENSATGEDGPVFPLPILENNSENQPTVSQNTTNSVSATSSTTTATVTAAAVAAATAVNPATTIVAAPVVTTPATTTSAATTTTAISSAVAAARPAAARPAAPRPAGRSTGCDPQTECRLRVANRNQRRRNQTEEVLNSFYITPFAVDQTEADVLEYIKEITNTEGSTLRCAKLVPRGKNADELTFISFKVTVSEDLVNIVSDSFYWPEGIEVREFQSKNGNRPVNLPQP